jgi:hypothetical protein
MKRSIAFALILLSIFVGISRATVVTIKAADVSVTTVPGGNLDNALVVHQDNAAAHGAVSANTPSKVVLRDANGRAQVVSPSSDNDIATKAYVDAISLTGIASYKNLKVTTTGAGTNQVVLLTADKVLMLTNGGSPLVRSTVSLTVNLAASGANGLASGSLAANTGYFLYVIDNGATTAGLASTSATDPTMPAGYTYKALVGWATTDNTATPFNIEEFTQIDDVYYWSTGQLVYTGTLSTSTLAIDLKASGILGYQAVPSNAKEAIVRMRSTAGAYLINPVTFSNSIGDDTPLVWSMIYLPGGSIGHLPAIRVPLVEAQTLYHQHTNTQATKTYVNGFTLKR